MSRIRRCRFALPWASAHLTPNLSNSGQRELGVALTQLGRPEEAIRNYQLALEVDPGDLSA